MSGLVDASIDGAAQVRWTTSQQEQENHTKSLRHVPVTEVIPEGLIWLA